MNHNIEFKGFAAGEALERKQGIRELIEDRLKHLEKRSKALSPTSMRAVVEEISAHKLYHVSITIELPGRTLVAKKETHDLEGGIKEAFAEIQRQLEDYKSSVRGEHFWKQFTRREEIRRQKSHTPPSELSETFFAVISPHLDRLKQFVRHVLSFAEARGDLPRGALAPEDIVDATLVQAYSEFVLNPTPGNIQAWLIRLATRQLAGEIKQAKFDREHTVHIEEDIPETPPAEEVVTLGDEILDFYQPDEDLKMEDIVPDVEIPTPEQEVEQKELRLCVRGAFATMPRDWRRVSLLYHIQGLTVEEIARFIERPESEVTRMLDEARDYLRQRLVASGCTLKGIESEEALRTTVEATSKKLVG